MSAFLGSQGNSTNSSDTRPTATGRRRNDDSIQSVDYRVSLPQYYDTSSEYRSSDILWPRSSSLGAGGNDGIASGQGGVTTAAQQYWEWNFPPTGGHVPKVVSGIVKDANGNPVAGATVQLFNTATGLLVDTQTSASDGSYKCGDPNAVACFAVGYLPGSPDTAGTTVDTITGT